MLIGPFWSKNQSDDQTLIDELTGQYYPQVHFFLWLNRIRSMMGWMHTNNRIRENFLRRELSSTFALLLIAVSSSRDYFIL